MNLRDTLFVNGRQWTCKPINLNGHLNIGLTDRLQLGRLTYLLLLGLRSRNTSTQSLWLALGTNLTHVIFCHCRIPARNRLATLVFAANRTKNMRTLCREWAMWHLSNIWGEHLEDIWGEHLKDSWGRWGQLGYLGGTLGAVVGTWGYWGILGGRGTPGDTLLRVRSGYPFPYLAAVIHSKVRYSLAR